MTRPSHLAIIRAIVAKDLREYARDRVWMVLTPVMLVAFVGLFWILPTTVEETVTVGIYQRGLDALVDQLAAGQEQGLAVVEYESPAALQAAVEARETVRVGAREASLTMGIAFPDDLVAAVREGRSTTVTLYIDSAVPSEFQTALEGFVREIAYSLAGDELPVTEPDQATVILGEDRVGDQVSFQERMRPLFAFFVLLTESIALAGLIAVEVQARTAKAIVATPASVADLLAAKGTTGMILALSQTLILLAFMGSFGHEPLLLVTAVVLASIMMSGVGMIAGSFGRDFMTTLFSSVVLIVPLAVPAFAVLFPGSASLWVQALPTYGVIDTLVGVTSYRMTWSGAVGNLALAAAWCVAVFAAGWWLLKRRVEAL
jgi:ABC-2 type transport system permease protein